MTEIEVLSLCTSIPIYLVLITKGCPFWMRLSRTLKTYSKRGAPYIASVTGQVVFVIHLDSQSGLLAACDEIPPIG
jgi:hypothetical protein